MEGNFCLLIGDADGKLVQQLRQVRNIDACTTSLSNHKWTSPASLATTLSTTLDTKYFEAEVTTLAVAELSAAVGWLRENGKKQRISCLIITLPSIEGECSREASTLHDVRALLSVFDSIHRDYSSSSELTATKILVVNSLRALESRSDVEVYCRGEEMELVEMQPDEETLKMAEQHHEAFGVTRLWELLETTTWPRMKMKPNPTKLPEHRHRIEKLIREAEDEDAILTLFDKPSHALPDEWIVSEDLDGSSASELLESLEEGRLGGVLDSEDPSDAAQSSEHVERILRAGGLCQSTFEPGEGGAENFGLVLQRIASGLKSRNSLNGRMKRESELRPSHEQDL